MVNVLLIDDDPQAHKTLAHVFPDSYALLSAYTGAEGIEAAAHEGPDVVLLDIGLPDMDGIEVLRRILARPSPPPVVMFTARSEHPFVKEAILAGACDYIVKTGDLKELLGTIRTAVARADARRAAAAVVGATLLDGLIGESASMREMKQLILRYAPSSSPVLITGESGTGKELVARSVHDASSHHEGPYLPLNCGAIAETLIETELFGSEKGAYTDAVARPGRFEQANGGTIFLDEVGEMSPAAQTRLLRVIEQRELTRVGGTRPIPLDVRVVSASNRELRPGAANGGMRPDLFYRLAVLPIHVPPLRDRIDDIPVLAVHFLSLLGKPGMRLGDDAREKLRSHAWPGNVRELRGVMERAALAAEEGDIRARDVTFY
jgi:DNA-binding NtrC family response regulator